VHIVVIGAGAVGTLMAVFLARAGHDLTIVCRPHQWPTLQRDPLEVIFPHGARLRARVQANADLLPVLASRDTDLVIVTVKAYDSEVVAQALSAVPSSFQVLTFQNGVGNEETFAAAIGSERVLSGALTTPVEVFSAGKVRVTRSSFRVGLAAVCASSANEMVLKRLGSDLTGQGFRVQWARDYRRLKWSKLLMNITANAQAALLAWPPARVFAHPVAGTLEVRAWREALDVMRSLGIRPMAFGGYPLPLAVPLIRYLPIPLVRSLMGRFASKGRGSKMPSVYLDLQKGKRQTEIPWLNGAVARYGVQAHVPTPVNAVLDALVAAVAERRIAWEEIRGHPERILREVQRQEGA